jgi:TonB-dependent receptor
MRRVASNTPSTRGPLMISKATLAACAATIAIVSNTAAAQVQAEYDLDLSEQSLARSLRAVASKTGTNIVFVGSVVRGKTAPALRGRYTAGGAYRALLQGSGLILRETSGGSYVVTRPTGGAPSTVSGRPAAEGAGSISGRVAQSDGNRNISGALVRIEETGQVATADDLGNFRFARVPTGTYTLTVSFLGFIEQSTRVDVVRGEQTNAEFWMDEGTNAAGEIVVYGSRSARANALNLQRTAENSSDVVSVDDLGNFTGTTISEALRRVPGVSFQRDGLTGDGTNITIRGLEPDMNAVKLNGLNLPVGNGVGRSPDLSNLLADSVSKITISKSLLPSQDSAGTGGLVEIETLSPLNRPRRYANLLIEGGKSGKSSNRSISYGHNLRYGEFLPPDADGNPTLEQYDAVDPLATFPFLPDATRAFPLSLGTSFNHVETENIAATLSAEWKVGDHSNLKFDYQHSEARRTTTQLNESFGVDLDYVATPTSGNRTALMVDLTPGNEALEHTQNYVYDRNARNVTDTYSLGGSTKAGRFEFEYLLGYARGSERHPSNFGLQLRMPAADARAEYFLAQATDPTLGYIVTPFGPRGGKGLQLPLLTEAGWDFVNDTSNFTIDAASGQIDVTRGKNDRYTAEYSAKFNAGWGPLTYIEAGVQFERVEFQSRLQRSQFGGNVPIGTLPLTLVPNDLSRIGVTGSRFVVISEESLKDFVDNVNDYVGGTSGLQLTPIVLPNDINRERTLEQNLAGYVQSRLDIGKLEIIGGVRLNRTRLEADNLVFPTYIGPIDPSNGGGFGIDLKFQNDFTRLASQKATTTDWLPRILFNYRQSDNLIFRGGYFLSVARPQIGQLSAQTRISFINIPIPGPEGLKPILTINTGNPDLKPATTHNFDLSVEYYDQDIGVLKLSGFYKRIKNLLQANATNGPAQLAAVPLPDHIYFQGAPYFDPANPQNYFITGSTPSNSDKMATIWGIEAQAERRLNFLPGALAGLGIYANYTFTKSKRWQIYNWPYGDVGDEVYEFSGIPFNDQPKHSGTVALTYNKYGIDATLAYGFQSRMLNNFLPRGLSTYREGVRTLDFRFEYWMQPSFGKLRLYVEGEDLLKGTSSPDLLGSVGGVGDTPRFYSGATYLGGRRVKAGVAVTF